MAATKEDRLRVLMLPWLGYGHISPFLELAKKLSCRNFYIYFCSTPINLTSIQNKLSPTDLSCIQLVELNLASSPELPPHCHTTNGLPSHLHPKLFQAFNNSKPEFSNILNTLKPDLVIYDSHQTWVSEVSSSHHIPAIYFHISSATSKSFFYYAFKNRGSGLPFPSSVVSLRPAEIQKMIAAAPIDAGKTTEDDDPFLSCIAKSCGFMLIKSCNDIEEKYLNYLSILTNKKVVPVGVLTYHGEENEEAKHDIEMLKWLDSKEKASTVYVSFGSETFLSKKETEELAFGLEISGVNFIWVIRFPGEAEKSKIEEVLPEGFVDRVKGRGIIVEGWAPQDKILGHSSTGGFVSHCGWSSVTESLSHGVPIIGLPMNFDQPLNCRMLVELGAGLEIEKDGNLVFQRTEVGRVIKEVVNGDSAVSKKAKELSENIKMNEEEAISAAAEELKNICTKI
ncbi:UDP-glucosyltransferase 29-like [Apium graveolens]|uniref:UDP-glucosyltransferase 29-like n=1 Tax=Apium graveolens TaxID=4045 RepID=UPI003D790342